jgi:large subunit ribosomal protein L3
MEISVPVTVLEIPPMNVVAVRAYEKFNGGMRPAAEAWTENLSPELSRALTVPKKTHGSSLAEMQALGEEIADVRVVAHTNPMLVSGVPKKVPELMEIPVSGSSMTDRLAFAQGLLGQQIPISSVFELGDLLDASAVTKGKGTQGPVRRWGIAIAKRKHARTGKLRHVGNLGPWHPAHISWRVPQLGQMGYHQRTEFNKRLMFIGTDGTEITPEGGFPGYGVVRNHYILIKGSLPGPIKRLVRIRHAIRPGMNNVKAPELLYTSKESKQGV